MGTAADRPARTRPGAGRARDPRRCAGRSCCGSRSPTCSAGSTTPRWRWRSPSWPMPPWPRRSAPPSRIVAAELGLAELGLRFSVIAMGRLGGRELGYGSDADVLFVYAGPERRCRRRPPGAPGRRAAARDAGRAVHRSAAAAGRRPAAGGPQRQPGALAGLLRRVLPALVVGLGGAGVAAGPVLRRGRRAGGAVLPADRADPVPGRRAGAGRRGGDPPDQGPGGRRAAAARRRSAHPHQARPGRAGRRRVDGAAAAAALGRTSCPGCAPPRPWPRCGRPRTPAR